MEVFICGQNSFSQLNQDFESSDDGDQTVLSNRNNKFDNSKHKSVLKPSCQLLLPIDADIDIHFTWSRCIFSVKKDKERTTTHITSTHSKRKTSALCFENTECASVVDGSGVILLRDTINPDKMSVLPDGMSQPMPVTIRTDDNNKSSCSSLQKVAGGHQNVHAIYDGVSFGKFQVGNSLEPSTADGDSERSEIILTIQHIDFATPIKEISCGKEHVLLLSMSGNVYSCGLSSRGQLGHGEIEREPSPRLVDALDGVPMGRVVAGGWHSVAISVTGRLNQDCLENLFLVIQGKGGYCDNPDSWEFRTAITKTMVDAILITEIGDLYVWGWNESGQLGLTKSGENMISKSEGDGSHVGIVATPACLDVPKGENVKDVACGSRHTVVLTETGSIFCCGWNGYGQLGLGDTTSRYSLTQIGGLTGRRVFAGQWNSAFLCIHGHTTPGTTD